MKSVMDTKVKSLIRETDSGYFVATLEDKSISFGMPDIMIVKTHNAEKKSLLLEASENFSVEDFETYIETEILKYL